MIDATHANKTNDSKKELNLPKLDLVLKNDASEVVERCKAFRSIFNRVADAIGKVIVGQHDIVQNTLIGLFADGHILLEGVPGLGKTLLIRTLSQTLDMPFSRLQFTPDLMPADIIGTHVLMEHQSLAQREMQFRPGPIFAQIILADEINRASPKTQSALLEAMQERCVSVANETYQLNLPFLVLATQNPIEQEGTYPLPEAQLDRFTMKLIVPYTTRAEMSELLERTTATQEIKVPQVLDGAHILQAQQLVRRVIAAPHVQDYAIRLILATHPGSKHASKITDRYVKLGASPRGVQALILTAKVHALINGRYHVSFDDLEAMALPVLRHRVMRNFEADAEGITSDEIIVEIMSDTQHEL